MSSRLKNCCSVCPHFACRTEHTTGTLYFVFFAFLLLLFKMNYRNKISILSMQTDKMEDNHKCYIWKKSQTEEKSVIGFCMLSKQFGPLSTHALWRKNCGCVIESNSYSVQHSSLPFKIFAFFSLLSKQEGNAKCRVN